MAEQLAALQQAVAALQQQIQGLSAVDVNTLQQQVNVLAAQLTAQTAVPSPVPRLKPTRPDTFSDVKTSGRPETWLFTVGTYFEAAGVADPYTVTFLATLLRGSAALWWQSHTLAVREATLTAIVTWEAFQRTFLEQFAPVSNVKQARDQLSALQQTKSVAHYTTEFRSLILQIPDASAAEQLDRYVRGLKPDVRRVVDLREPANLQAAMRLADRADSHLDRASPAGVFLPEPAPAPAPTPAAEPVPVPMDINAVGSQLSATEKGLLTKQGRCFVCKKRGHRANNCRSVRSS